MHGMLLATTVLESSCRILPGDVHEIPVPFFDTEAIQKAVEAEKARL